MVACQVVEALQLARAAITKIRANLAWALVYNVVALPLAAGALLPACGVALTPSTAGGMMAFSSLAVVANSLALQLQFRQAAPPPHQPLASTPGRRLKRSPPPLRAPAEAAAMGCVLGGLAGGSQWQCGVCGLRMAELEHHPCH